MDTDLLDTPATAKRLGVKPPTLEAWRYKGTGPAWVRVGRLVKYRAADIEDYLTRGTHQAARAPRDPAAMLLGAAA